MLTTNIYEKLYSSLRL